MAEGSDYNRMNLNGLGKDKEGHIVQAVPLVEGKVKLTTGTYFTRGVIHCVEDGQFTVTWTSGATDQFDAVAGEDFSYYGDVTIDGGMFHLC